MSFLVFLIPTYVPFYYVDVAAHLPNSENEHDLPLLQPQPSIFANSADMKTARSLKSDPFGVMDTRLMMNDSSADDFLSLHFPAFARSDGLARNPVEAETSPKRGYRILGPRESFSGFEFGRKCPRLELDATVDKYHLLDGLNEPLDPQNTPASNSERQGTPEPHQLDTANMQTSPAPQIEKFNFDCFSDSPESGLFGKHRLPKLRRLSGNPRPLYNAPATGLGDQRPASDFGGFASLNIPKPGHLSDNQEGQWFKHPVTGLGNPRPDLNVSAFKKPSDPGSGVRCVRFSLVATSPSPPRAMRRPMPPLERKLDDHALYRQKRCEKWRITRPTSLPRSPSPKRMGHSSIPLVPDGTDVRFPSLSSLASCEVKQKLSLAQPDDAHDPVEVATGNAVETAVSHASNASQCTAQDKPFVNVSFSLYRLRQAPRSSAGNIPKYAFEFRKIETDVKSLPDHPFRQFPPEFEHTIGPIVVDDLLFHTCFIVTPLAVELPLAVFSAATQHLTDTQGGTAIVFLARALLLLMKHIAALVLSMCGVTFSCRWCPPTGDSD
jgi:hypothetical protein